MSGNRKERTPVPHSSSSGPRPSRAPEPVSKRPDAEETLRLVLARLDDMKAEDTVTIDLTGKTSIADAMVVTSGRSNRHVTLDRRQRDRRPEEGRREGSASKASATATGC